MNIIKVSALNMYVESVLCNDQKLKNIYVSGEIADFRGVNRSGHLYLTLRDGEYSVPAVFFRNYAERLAFVPENGMKVICRGSVTVYTKGGRYQFNIQSMQPDGAGALAVAFEQLKMKLAAEGLFDEAHKKNLPYFPKRIGVITSPTGAARHDIEKTLNNRYPSAEIVFCPSAVQGAGAGDQLAECIRLFYRRKNADVIIIGRGGGSMEDLWEFNSEKLARAIYDCSIPVVSGVGHETDFTICDFVSDFRAATPTAAAEKVSETASKLPDIINGYNDRINSLIKSRIDAEKNRLDLLARSRCLSDPLQIVYTKQMQLDHLTSEMKSAYSIEIKENKTRFTSLASKLDALSPLKVLSRGFAYAESNGKCITSVSAINTGDSINVRLTDGQLECRVERKVSDNG